jgi:hypothetical protein
MNRNDQNSSGISIPSIAIIENDAVKEKGLKRRQEYINKMWQCVCKYVNNSRHRRCKLCGEFGSFMENEYETNSSNQGTIHEDDEPSLSAKNHHINEDEKRFQDSNSPISTHVKSSTAAKRSSKLFMCPQCTSDNELSNRFCNLCSFEFLPNHNDNNNQKYHQSNDNKSVSKIGSSSSPYKKKVQHLSQLKQNEMNSDLSDEEEEIDDEKELLSPQPFQISLKEQSYQIQNHAVRSNKSKERNNNDTNNNNDLASLSREPFIKSKQPYENHQKGNKSVMTSNNNFDNSLIITSNETVDSSILTVSKEMISQSIETKKIMIVKNKWECPQCTYHNPKRSKVCDICKYLPPPHFLVLSTSDHNNPMSPGRSSRPMITTSQSESKEKEEMIRKNDKVNKKSKIRSFSEISQSADISDLRNIENEAAEQGKVMDILNWS